MKVNFYKRNTKLYIQIRHRHDRITRSLEEVSDNLTIENNRAIGISKEAIHINKLINEIESIISGLEMDEMGEAIDQYLAPDQVKEPEKILLYEYMDRFLASAKAGKIKRSGKRLSHKTIKVYERAITYYKEYVGDMDIDINDADISKATDKVRHIQNMESHFDGYIMFLQEEKNLMPATRSTYWTKVKAIILDLKRRTGVIIPTGNLYVPTGENKTFFWPNQLTRNVLSFEGDIPEVDRDMITAMQVQILCTMRAGDLFNLQPDHFSQREFADGTLNMLVYRNQKGEVVAKGTLPEKIYFRALSNLQKYGRIIPTHRDNLWAYWYSGEIREILRKYFDGDNITSPMTKQKVNGEVYTENVAVSEATSSHTLRKAGITLLSKGVDRNVLEQYTGHKKGSKMIDNIYTGVDDEDFYNAQQLQEALINIKTDE